MAIVVGVLTWVSRQDDGAEHPVADGLPAVVHNKGGSVRLAVTTPPELADAGDGGKNLRRLVYPRLFEAGDDGTWAASLVAPGSDRTAADNRSATFRLRPGALWSDGSTMGVADLRRTADPRFVASVDDVAADGTITVHFTQPLPGWRRLWSGDAAIAPAVSGVSGGPYVVTSVTSGLETVLARNDRWYGATASGGPFLDEVHLLLVPGEVNQRTLLDSGVVDVISSPAAPQRTAKVEAIEGVRTVQTTAGGAWSALIVNGANASLERRRALLSTFPRSEFADALLAGEVTLLDDFATGQTWTNGAEVGDRTQLAGYKATLSTSSAIPVSDRVFGAYRHELEGDGATLSNRAADDGAVRALVTARTFDVALIAGDSEPTRCWQCEWGSIDSGLSTRADAGDVDAMGQLQQKMRVEALVLPLWRTKTVVGFRIGSVDGVVANGFVPVAGGISGWWKP